MTGVEALAIFCGAGCGLIGGVFFAFSTSVMTALGRAPWPAGMATMQTINVVILNPVFLGVFLGTAAGCAWLLGLAVLEGSAGGVGYGAALYLMGCFLVTVVCNVPRNNRLAALDPAAPGAEAEWRKYVREWTAWNHVRAVASLAAAVAFLARGI